MIKSFKKKQKHSIELLFVSTNHMSLKTFILLTCCFIFIGIVSCSDNEPSFDSLSGKWSFAIDDYSGEFEEWISLVS